MESAVPAELLKELRSYIDREVAAGFLSPDQIVESAVDLLAGDASPGALRFAAVKSTAEAIEAHKVAQSHWPAHTDCDKLDAAFEELERLGILSKQNFSCCGTCGAGEIVDEMAAAVEQGQKVYGYAFYHEQDTEAAVEGYGLCLNYGTDRDDEESALEVARKVVDVLEAHGLATTWDGTWGKRIAITLEWKRRGNIATAF